MWAIVNRTSFEAGKAWVRDKDGVHQWIVAVKGTFEIRPDGRVALADTQVPALMLSEYSGEPGASSVKYDADVVPPKPTTDITVNATAYAPGGRPSRQFLVSMRVGAVSKTIRVTGHRTGRGGAFSALNAPEPVTEIPITYERAYGGYEHTDPDPTKHQLDTRNPVGRGIARRSAQAADMLLPNFEYPSGDPHKTGPAGFGAIDTFWSPRRELMGTYDDAWKERRFPLLPGDWDPRSLLCSPRDQQPERHLRGGEPVELSNMTRDGALRFVLPAVSLRFVTRFATSSGWRTEEHVSSLSSVIIEPDRPRVMMVWSSALTCTMDPDYLEETVVREVALR